MWKKSDCQAVSDLLWSYMAHRLSEQDMERVERHLAHCNACRTEADGYRYTVDALGTLRRQPLPESRRGWQEVQSRLVAGRAVQQPLIRGKWSLPSLAWGSMAVAAASVFWIVSSSGHKNDIKSANVGNSAAVPSSPVAMQHLRPAVPITTPVVPVHPTENHAVATTAGHPHKNRLNSHAMIALANTKTIHHALHPVIHWMPAEPQHHSRSVIARLNAAQHIPVDYRSIDGGRASASNEAGNYVLTPVAASSDADGDYVLGGVVMNGRPGSVTTVSDDTEEARGW